MRDEKKKKEIKKRLPAPVVIGLRKLKRSWEDLEEAYAEWHKERCDELGKYADTVDLGTGVVLDSLSRERIVERLPLEGRTKQIMAEAAAKIIEKRAAEKAFKRLLQNVTYDYGIPSKTLNIDTGEVESDAVFVDMKTREEQDAEAAAQEKVLPLKNDDAVDSLDEE